MLRPETTGLLTFLADVPDPRGRPGRRFPLAAMLARACCALLCGCRGYAAIAQWGRDAAGLDPGPLGVAKGLHYVRDVTMGEDANRTRVGSGPQVLAAVRHLAVSKLRLEKVTNVAASLRRNAARVRDLLVSLRFVKDGLTLPAEPGPVARPGGCG